MSAELFRRATDDADGELIRKLIVDLENTIAEREDQIFQLEKENRETRQRIRDLEALATVHDYTPVNAPLEFTETPGTYVPISKPSEVEKRIRKALLSIDAATIKDWEETEQALRKAAVGEFETGTHLYLPRNVDDSDAE